MNDDIAAPAVPHRPVRKTLGLPRLSGRSSALALLLCFAATAVLIPMILGLPTWIEAELVLACWWLIWGVVLSVLLYRRVLVKDDYAPVPAATSGQGWTLRHVIPSGSYDTGGDSSLLGCLLSMVVYILALAVIWLFVELVIPLLAFTLYFLMKAMLAAALKGRHRCRGRLWLSLGLGWLWATVFTVPLALLVWVVHAMAKLSTGG